MKSSNINTKFAYEAPARWVIAALVIVTLYFQTNLADPFNSPKMWSLLAVSSWLIGYIYFHRDLIFSNQILRKSTYFVFAFLFATLLASLFTDFKYIAIFGDTQRRNGFISYFGLVVP